MKFASLIAFLFLSSNAIAGTSMPSTFTYQGRLMNAAGNAALAGNLTLYIEIKNPSGSCLLYSEHQPVNTTTTSGIFSIQIGAGTRTNAVAGYDDDPGYQFSEIFTNKQDFAASASCAGGWTPGTTDARMLRIHVYDGSTTTTLADQALSPVPQASVADTIDGVPLQGLTLNWTTATRPVNPVNGMHGYNDTLNRFEKWNGATWVSTTPKFSAAVINDTATDNYVLKWNDGTDTWEPADVMTLLDTPGGDVSGTIANMNVEAIQGQTVAATAPNSGEVLKWNGSEWEAAPDTDSGVLVASGSGTQYRVPIFNASGELADSVAYDNGTVFGIQSDLDMNTHKIINLVDPTAGKDAATKDYVDSAVGGSGQTTIAGGTQDRVSKFNAAGDNVVDSSITDNGSLVTINNPLVSTGSITTDGPLVLKEIADPTQTAGYGKIYVKADNTVWYMDEAGVPQQFVFGAGAGEVNTASSTGGTADVYKQKTGVDLEFRGVTGSANITVTENANDIEISATGLQTTITAGTNTDQVLKWDGDSWEPAFASKLYESDGGAAGLTVDAAGVVSVTNNHTVTAGNDVADKDYVDSAVSTLSAVTDVTGGDAITATETLGTYDIDVNVDNSTIEVNADALRIKDGGVTRAKLAAGSSLNDILKWDGDSWELASDEEGTIISGGTNNVIPKFNATGDNIGNSSITDSGTLVSVANPLAVNGPLVLQEQGADPAQTAGHGKIYVKADNTVWYMDEAGTPSQFVFGSGAGEVNTGSSLGGTADVFASKSGADLRFRGVTGSANITVTENANDIEIAATGLQASLTAGTNTDQVLKWDGDSWEPAFTSKLYESDGGAAAMTVDASGVVTLTNNHTVTAGNDVADKDYVDTTVGAIDGLPAMTDAQIIVANGTTATAVTMNGDVTIDNTGLTTIDDEAVTLGKLADGTSNGQVMFWDSTNTTWTYATMTGLADGKILKWDAACNTGAGCWEVGDDAGASGTVATIEGASGTVDLQNGSTGTAPNWTQSGSNVTLHVPLASGAGVTSGTISKADYDRIPASGATNDTVMRWNGTAWVETDGIKIEADGDVVLKNAPTANDHVADKEYVDTAVSTLSAVTDVTGGDAITATDTAGVIDVDVNVDNSTIEVNADQLRIKDGGVGLTKLAAGSASGDIMKWDGDSWELAPDAGGTSISGGTQHVLPKFNATGDNVVNSQVSDDGTNVVIATDALDVHTGTKEVTVGQGGLVLRRTDNHAVARGRIGYSTAGHITFNNSMKFTTANENKIYNQNTNGSYIDIGGSGGNIHTFATSNWANGSHTGIRYDQPSITPNLTSYTSNLAYMSGTVTSTAVTTVNGLRSEITDNSSAIANNIVGLNVNVGLGTNASANRYAALFQGGHVGIGTTAPATKLEITGGSSNENLRLTSQGTGGPAVNLINAYVSSTNFGNAHLRVGRGRTDYEAGVKSFTDGVADSGSTPSWFAGLAPLYGVGGSYNYTITESNGSSNARLSIIPGGNVGIGTVSPNEKLTVSGNMSLAQQGSAPSATADFGKIYVTGDGASQKLFFKNENNDVFDLTLASGGGTVASLEGATGAVDLQNGSTGTTPNWTQSGSNVTLHVPLASGAGVTSGTISKADYDRIPANGATNDTVMRWNGTAWVETDGIKIEADGDVVLKNAPTANDHVTDKEYVDNAVSAVDVPAVTDGTTAGQTLRWDGDSWEPMDTIFVDAAGEVGIGNTNPQFALDVAGQINVYKAATNARLSLTGDASRSAEIFYQEGANRWGSGAMTNTVTGLGSRFVIASHYATGAYQPDMVMDGNGKIIIGGLTPTARLHLPAGTTVAGTAPLKFEPTAATLTTAAENGAMEFDGTDYYLTAGGTRKKILTSTGGTGDYVAKTGDTMTGVLAVNLTSADSYISSKTTTSGDAYLSLTTVGQQDWSIGVDRSDSGKLKFSSAVNKSSPKLTLDTTGNVGIGTTNPSSNLHVNASSGADSVFQMSDGDVAHGIFSIIIPTDVYGRFASVNSTKGGLDITGLNDDGTSQGLKLNGILGSATPTAAIPAMSFSASKKDAAITQAIGATETTFQFSNLTTPQITILGSGNVGIGINAPTYLTHIKTAAEGGDLLAVQADTQVGVRLGVENPGGTPNHQIGTLKFDGSTNVGARRGIGGIIYGNTANDLFQANNGVLQFEAQYNSGTVATANTYSFNNNGTAQMYISAAGNMTVAANVTATSFISTSDARLKNNISTMSGMDSINQLRGVEWSWKSNGTHDAGVIAQELEEVFPHAVVTDPNTGYKSVKYSYLIAPLIEAAKENYNMSKMSQAQIAKIESMLKKHDRQIASLEVDSKVKDQRIKNLESENAQLKKRLELIEKKLGIK